MPPKDKATNPFDIPELRHRLSRFVTLKDALSCVRVSKAWTEAFVSVIWFKVDFDIHTNFPNLPPATITKHGHHIRLVDNAKTLPQVSALATASVNKLRALHIDTAASTRQHVQAYEIVSRNRSTFQNLRLFASTTNKPDSLAHYIATPALAPFSGSTKGSRTNLTSMSITRLSMTRDGLGEVLQACPLLVDLKLFNIAFTGTSTSTVRHTGVRTLTAGLKAIFHQDGSTPGPSLLTYFPRLVTLSTWDYQPDSAISAGRIKEELDQYCPHVKKYHLNSTGAAVSDFCSKIARTVSEIVFLYEQMSTEVIIALLLHQNSLSTVRNYWGTIADIEKDDVAAVNDHFQAHGQFLQLLPRGCSRLEVLDLHCHEMDMDVVEVGEWACKDLRMLYVRIKGLDTKDKIIRAISLWRDGRRARQREEDSADDAMEVDEDYVIHQNLSDRSIETRVARHLLKFEKLEQVWLGYKIWLLK
ncbi:hypothetical protein BGX33_005312 [Mortierella sp. NVP41]|nr:hypothetical protein BGX33_005312 [Mortierella sp. NVP41]